MPPRNGMASATLAVAMIGALGIGGSELGSVGNYGNGRRRFSRGHRGSNTPRWQVDCKVRARRQEAKKARRVNRQKGK